MKRLAAFAVLVGALTFGVANVSASQSFHAGIYGNTTFTCAAGSTDTSGARYGWFTAIETHNYQWVDASVTLDNLYGNQLYSVSVTQSGSSCLTDHNVVWFYTNAKGQAIVHFFFWAHTGETSAWVTVQTTSVFHDTRRSTALPINR
jgi:hypothetical protein